MQQALAEAASATVALGAPVVIDAEMKVEKVGL